jgi:hypothetical protein
MAGQRTTARTDDPELVRAQEYLTEIEDRLLIDGSTGEASSRPIFDAGLRGLEFFRRFGPSYARFREKSFNFESDIVARYNAQREIGFSRLYADAERFNQLCSTMTESDLDYRNSANSLFDYWQGDAADRAKATVTGFLTSSGSVWAGINGLGRTLRAASRAAERIAFDKAKAVLALGTDTVGGLTDENVELLVDIALLASGAAIPGDYLVDAAQLAGVAVNPAVCRSNQDVLNMVLDSAQDWLQDAFVPAYEARLAVFETACDQAQADLDQVWASVAAAIGDLAEHSVGTFDGLRNPPAPTPAATAPTPTTVSSTPTTETPAPSAPASAQPTPTAAPSTPTVTPSAPSAPAPVHQAVAQHAAPPPSTQDSPTTGHGYVPSGGSSIAARLDPQPAEPPADQASAGVLDADAGGGTDNDAQHHDTGLPGVAASQPAEQPAPGAAPTPGGSFMQPPRMAPEGGSRTEHKRKVPVTDKPVPEQPDTAAPAGVIGGADDPVAYNEAAQYDDDSLSPRQTVPPAEQEPLVEQKKPEPPPTVWRLNEDGEIESVMLPPPKTDTQGSSS